MAESKQNSTLEMYKSDRGSDVAASLPTVSCFFFVFFLRVVDVVRRVKRLCSEATTGDATGAVVWCVGSVVFTPACCEVDQ